MIAPAPGRRGQADGPSSNCETSRSDENAERLSVRVGEDPQRLVGIIRAVEAGPSSEREHALVDSFQFHYIPNHEI